MPRLPDRKTQHGDAQTDRFVRGIKQAGRARALVVDDAVCLSYNNKVFAAARAGDGGGGGVLEQNCREDGCSVCHDRALVLIIQKFELGSSMPPRIEKPCKPQEGVRLFNTVPDKIGGRFRAEYQGH